MTEENVRLLFDYYLYEKARTLKSTGETVFSIDFIRKVSRGVDFERLKKSNDFILNNFDVKTHYQYCIKCGNEIADNALFEFLKMLYGKSPDYFITDEYKAMSIEFNKIISENPSVKSKIEQILRNGKVSLKEFSSDKELSKLLFLKFKNINDIQCNAINDIFGDSPFFKRKTNARVYVNPNKQFYAEFLNYVLVECMKEEIPVYYKPRHDEMGGKDSLILYIPDDCLGRVLNILNRYERNNKEKVASFPDSPLFLERNSHKWYGFGHEIPGINLKSGEHYDGTILNEDVEYMFAAYIFPLLLF